MTGGSAGPGRVAGPGTATGGFRAETDPRPLPRLAFVGVGWIGRDRLRAVVESRTGDVAALVDPDPERLEAAAELAPDAVRLRDLEGALDRELDGVVLATPSAVHAEQARTALRRGLAVFCQKPLGRSAREARAVVEAARRADRLLGVDLAYRHAEAGRRLRERVREGALGRVHLGELAFHNAYGPDAGWYRDPVRSGGGCVIDLGIHLVDLALWTLDFPRVERVSARLWAGGEPLPRPLPADIVEDAALARLDLEGGASLRLACSWNLHAGRDAVLEAALYGTDGGVRLRNVDGSFYDFVAEAMTGTRTVRLADPPDAWPGRAAVAWARRLRRDPGYDPEAERHVEVARVLDRIYGRAEET